SGHLPVYRAGEPARAGLLGGPGPDNPAAVKSIGRTTTAGRCPGSGHRVVPGCFFGPDRSSSRRRAAPSTWRTPRLSRRPLLAPPTRSGHRWLPCVLLGPTITSDANGKPARPGHTGASPQTVVAVDDVQDTNRSRTGNRPRSEPVAALCGQAVTSPGVSASVVLA